jgi:hypothetical protein
VGSGFASSDHQRRQRSAHDRYVSTPAPTSGPRRCIFIWLNVQDGAVPAHAHHAPSVVSQRLQSKRGSERGQIEPHEGESGDALGRGAGRREASTR